MAREAEERRAIVGEQGTSAPPAFGGHVRGPQAKGRPQGPRGAATVRLFEPRDEQAVLGLLTAAFGRWPHESGDGTPQEFFRWKHLGSPFGRSLMLVAELEGNVAGFYAYMPWPLSSAGRIVPTMRGVDLVVGSRYRGHRVSLAMRTSVEFSPEVVLMWGNPNVASSAGSRSLGQNEVSRLRSFVRPAPALAGTLGRLAKRKRADRPLPAIDAPSAAEALADGELLARLALRSDPQDARLTTPRSDEFLRWRYGFSPGYRALRIDDRGATGLAIFRRARRGPFAVASVCELLLTRRDARLERRLLGGVGRAAGADFVACTLGSRGEGMQRGLFAYRSRENLTVELLDQDASPDPRAASSWALSRGDLELL